MDHLPMQMNKSKVPASDTTMIIILYLLVFVNLTYGISHVARNNKLPKLEKLLWLILIICMPVIGTTIYLRSSFHIKHGNR
jgi:hypothetical protein